jgi:hypothetical protein
MNQQPSLSGVSSHPVGGTRSFRKTMCSFAGALFLFFGAADASFDTAPYADADQIMTIGSGLMLAGAGIRKRKEK